ncbi:MAG: hypothetical protein HUU26_02850 [Gemmatimonadaceae bacterium]|nr:hypothetical protein [Gemmatimonadaceae bacterium]
MLMSDFAVVTRPSFPSCAVRAVVAAGAAAFLLRTPPPVAAQAVGVIPDGGECTTCRIRTALWATLRPASGDQEIIRTPSSIATTRSRAIVVARGGDGPPLVFDSTGELRRVLSKQGSGPGEFESTDLVVADGSDTVLFLDRRLQRLSFFGPDWRYLRSAPMPDGVSSIAVVTPGQIVAAAEFHDAARFGHPYHLLDRTGNYVRSFGAPSGPILPGVTLPLGRLVTPAQGGGFWAIPVHGEYRLEKWSANGTLRESITRRAPWFPRTPSPRFGFTRDGDTPSPQVISLVEDASGLIWVAIRVVDRNWPSGVRWTPAGRGESSMRPTIEDRSRAFDIIIEAVDVRRRRVAASLRLDDAWIQFVAPGRYFRVHEDQGGLLQVELYTIRLDYEGRQDRH